MLLVNDAEKFDGELKDLSILGFLYDCILVYWRDVGCGRHALRMEPFRRMSLEQGKFKKKVKNN